MADYISSKQFVGEHGSCSRILTIGMRVIQLTTAVIFAITSHDVLHNFVLLN